MHLLNAKIKYTHTHTHTYVCYFAIAFSLSTLKPYCYLMAIKIDFVSANCKCTVEHKVHLTFTSNTTSRYTNIKIKNKN